MTTPNVTATANGFDFMAPSIMWWSLDEGVARARMCGVRISRSRLRVIGNEGKRFLYGAAAGAPSSRQPIHRVSFEQWLAGGNKINAKLRKHGSVA